MEKLGLRQEHIGSFDLLRVFASFAVILLHVSAQGFYVIQPYWNTALIYNSLARVGVPLFFMMSGAFLIPKMESLTKLFTRVVRRVFLPYVTWSIIYIAYNTLTLGTPFSIRTILQQAPYFHLPFLFQILSLYLTLPLLRGFWTNVSTTSSAKLYVLSAALLSGILIDFVFPLIGRSLIGFTISFLPYYAGLAMLGAYLREIRLKVRFPALLLLVYLLCSAITAYLTHWKSFSTAQPTEVFFVYQSPLTIIGTMCLFQFFNQFQGYRTLGKISSKVSSVTLSIFLMHPLILNLLLTGNLGFTLSWNLTYPLIWIPIFSLAIFLLCLGLGLFWKKIAQSVLHVLTKTYELGGSDHET